MTRTPLSPRQEALNSVLAVRGSIPGATIDPDTWDKLVGIAWDHRTASGDRREIQRELRQVLLAAARQPGA
jgi:hypothetical protein